MGLLKRQPTQVPRREPLQTIFQRERSVITKHIHNVFKEGELAEKNNVQNLHIAGSDKPVRFFNLDVVISVGYRVKSKRGTQFRIWATQVLRDHLLKGYSILKDKTCWCASSCISSVNNI